MNNNPIAVIDSGVGGLACLSSIRSMMPNEDIIYFGDTADMPFGSKTEDEIRAIAIKICKYLSSKDVKMIILACGTLSSIAINDIYKACPMMLVQGIVEPAVAFASRSSVEGDKIGVIATTRTIESGSHKAVFDGMRKKYDVYYKACPDLASLIESGVTEGEELEAMLREYLDEMVNENHIKSLLLGCTHYPLVSECIKKLYPELVLLDPAAFTAKLSSNMLKIHELAADPEKEGTLKLCASRKTDGFRKMADMLGFEDIEIEEVEL